MNEASAASRPRTRRPTEPRTHRHAGELQRAPVAADGEHVAPSACGRAARVSANTAAMARIGTGAEPRALVEPAHRRRQPGDRVALGEHHRDALRDSVDAERDEERRHSRVGDERAVADARRRADREGGDPPRPAGRRRPTTSIPITAAQAEHAPRLRSMPSVRMTSVIPSDTMMSAADCSAMLDRLRGEELRAREREARREQREQIRGAGQLGQPCERRAQRARRRSLLGPPPHLYDD